MDTIAVEWIFHEFTSHWVQVITLIKAVIFVVFSLLMDGYYVIVFSHLQVLLSLNLFLDCWIIFHACIVAASYIVNAVKGGILVLWMELWEEGCDLVAEYKLHEFWILRSSTAVCLVYNRWVWTCLFSISKWWITFKLWEIQLYV